VWKPLTPYLLYSIYRLLYFTWRIQILESKTVKEYLKNNSPFILAHWHGDELGILHLLKRYHVACIISTSKDGDIMDKAVRLLGAQTVRGSSTRGGASALKGIIRLKKQGRRPSVAVDGPKGPIHQVKPGVFQISRLTQLPIVPISFFTNRGYIFTKSWNKSWLPLPFAQVTVVLGEPIPSVKADDDAHSPLWAELLKDQLMMTRESAKKLAKV